MAVDSNSTGCYCIPVVFFKMSLEPQNSVDGLWHHKHFIDDIYKLDVQGLVVENFTLWSTRVRVAELV